MRTLIARIVAAVTLAAAFTASGFSADVTAKRRLAGHYIRAALTIAQTETITISGLEGAIMLLHQAVRLQPDDPDILRMLLEVLDLADRAENDPLRVESLQKLTELDPADQVAQLRLINVEIGRHQTVEGRTAAYRQLLKNPSLQPVVASRLAMDLATLLSRSGDTEGYGEWLGKAVELDPSNRAATAAAAGFFRSYVTDDPFAEAELLVTVMLSDPTDLNIQAALAQVLLDTGAFEAADRIYQLTRNTYLASGALAPSGLLADHAIAQWGLGQAQAALQTVRERQSEANAAYRSRRRREDPSLSPLDLAREQAPIASTLATIRAAIHSRLGDEQAVPTYQSADVAYKAEFAVLQAQDPQDPTAMASTLLRAVMVSLWLSDDSSNATSLIGILTRDVGDALTPEARERFDGLLALQRGDFEDAVARLQPLAADDPAAQLGLARAYQKLGRHRDAAINYLAVARAQPGSLMGVWAADALADLVGRRLKPGEMNDVAPRLHDLIKSIPNVIDRYPFEPRLAVSIRLVPTKPAFDPYEPVIVNVEITNNGPFPLAIDNGGPIRPRIYLVPRVQITHQRVLGELKPIIVDIDQRLSLAPRERITIPVDLRQRRLGQLLNTAPLRGSIIKLRGVVNAGVTQQGVIRPRMLGMETETRSFRVNGVRADGDWATYAMGEILDPDSSEDLALMGQLARFTQVTPTGGNSELMTTLLEDCATAIARGYEKLNPYAQAWLMATLPTSEGFKPIRDQARLSTHKDVRLAFILFQMTDVDDPMIEAVRSGDDPDLILAVNVMADALQQAAAARAAQDAQPPITAPAGGGQP